MRKQLIFLMTDTTRKDMVGCYGNPKMKTPNLDRLAEEGIRYENAYTCSRSVDRQEVTIFTGTFPQHEWHGNKQHCNGGQCKDGRTKTE